MRIPSACALALLAVLPATGQEAAEANRHYETESGRQQMLRLLSSPDRADQIQAEKLVAGLDLKPGNTVVDLGAGAGVLLPHLSRAVGETGKVFAQDIQKDFLDAARSAAGKAGLTNVEYIQGTARDPWIPRGIADLIVTVDAYHHFDYPKDTLAGVWNGLKPGGRFVVVDYYRNGFRDPNHIRVDKPQARHEIEAAGFRLVEDREHVPGTQYMLIFVKP